MILPGSARKALRKQLCLHWAAIASAIFLAGFSFSCGSSSSSSSSASHIAYVTLPQTGAVRLLHLNNSSGAITIGAETPPTQGTTPTGLALDSSKKFLYVANSDSNTISIFKVAGDGTLTLSGTPIPGDGGPREMVLDPSGQFLLVTNAGPHANTVSVFSVNSGAGTLTEVSGSPFPAHEGPSGILITPSGKFVYVTSPSTGFITAFTFAGGVLTEVTGSPFGSGKGVSALTVESSEHFLYATNTTDNTISGFTIDPATGGLKPVPGSPFSSTAGAGPAALAVDTLNKFLYVATPGSTSSVWAFTFDSATGTLTPVPNSPFSLSAGGSFLVMEPGGSFFYIGNQSGPNIAAYKYDSGTGVPTAVTGSPFSTGSAPGSMVIVH
jgi:6-phosphogluconolactonase (cycloisomerase 2 family)